MMDFANTVTFTRGNHTKQSLTLFRNVGMLKTIVNVKRGARALKSTRVVPCASTWWGGQARRMLADNGGNDS